jgi:hypothetical protein
MDSTDQEIDARFAEQLDRHLGAHLCPLIEAINALIGQLVEQIEARERIAQSYLEQNAELRIEVAKLAENVAAMRNATPPLDATVN